jgi:hypothetical protein
MRVPRAEIVKLLDVGDERLSLFGSAGRRCLHFDHRFNVIRFDSCYDVRRPSGPAGQKRLSISPKYDDVALLGADDLQFELNTAGLELLCMPVPGALGYYLHVDGLRGESLAKDAPESRLQTHFTKQ